MAYLNLVQIIGNLGRDPDYFGGQDNKQPFANLSVATTHRYRGRDEQVHEITEWHRVVVYGNIATNCQRYLRRGSSVYVSGRLQTRKYTDKTGAERYQTEIIASDVQFLDSRQSDQQGVIARAEETAASQVAAYPSASEDSPF